MSILTDKTPIGGIEKQTIKILESLGFWWGNSPVSTEKQLTNIFDDTYMRLSEVKEDGSMSFLFESVGEFPSAWWQTLTMDEIREMADGDSEQDAPITPEFLEGLGFEENFESEHIKESGVFDDYICITVDTRNRKIKVDMGRGTGRNLPHIRTQSQLTNLIAALFGGGE